MGPFRGSDFCCQRTDQKNWGRWLCSRSERNHLPDGFSAQAAHVSEPTARKHIGAHLSNFTNLRDEISLDNGVPASSRPGEPVPARPTKSPVKRNKTRFDVFDVLRAHVGFGRKNGLRAF